jgi:hypothetical protein
MLRKSVLAFIKRIDRIPNPEHSEEGSKRFEEQQAGGNVANLER